jgi:membrane protein
MNMTALWKLLTNTFTEWNEDKPFQLATALSYYTLFSLAPLLIIALAVAGLFFGVVFQFGSCFLSNRTSKFHPVHI